MADHPLKSATHRCLGGPLPRQQANGTRTHPYAIACKQRPSFLKKFILSVSGISSRFQLLSPCTRQVTHALLTRPPLSHKIISPEGNQIKCFVRLACVKHAASVHPEPGSNSHVKKLISVKLNLANSFIQIESEFTVLKVFNFH